MKQKNTPVFVKALVLLLLWIPGRPAGAAAPPGPKAESWSVLLDRARKNQSPAVSKAKKSVIGYARSLVKRPLLKRVYRHEDVAKPDGPHRHMKDPIRRELAALAHDDTSKNGKLKYILPALAAAYRLTGEKAFRERLLMQLEEMKTWSPLQRGGWSGVKYPRDYKSKPWWGGSWLATGTGVRAIADTLEIMPEDSIPDDLREALHKLLEKEIAQITDDWRVKRQWFVKRGSAYSNQWVLPTEGLIRACLVLGPEKHKQAYALGVTNILKTLDSLNPDGSYPEGWVYSTAWTMPSLVCAGRAMALRGDRRVLDHPFMKRYPRWLAHQFQPGKQFIQYFDGIAAARDNYEHLTMTMAQVAVCTGAPDARWLLKHQVGKYPWEFWGVVATMSLPGNTEDRAPPLFAAYEGARCVMWRSSWEDNADGAWVRGGHPKDAHDHRDRGHVSYTSRGRMILIECGTPSYGHDALASHFQSGAGHNILQLGDGPMPKPVNRRDEWKKLRPSGWQQKGVVAPIEVHRLDKRGGDVTVTLTSGYPNLERWNRRVVWNGNLMQVTDTVRLKKPQVVLFRWHLGTEEIAEIKDASATWSKASLAIRSDTPLTLRQTRRMDHVFDAKDHSHEHACLVVHTRDRVDNVSMTMVVTPKRLSKRRP